jgi:hypothetical protein
MGGHLWDTWFILLWDEQAVWAGSGWARIAWAGCLAIPIFQKWGFCISQSPSPPNLTQAQYIFHQPFLLWSTASTMQSNSCKSAIAFINPRILHAGHTNLHDPIDDDNMTTTTQKQGHCYLWIFFCLIVVFAVVCSVLSWLLSRVIDLKFDAWDRQKTVIGVSLWVTMNSMYLTARTDIWRVLKKCEFIGIFFVHGQRPAWVTLLQGERPAHRAVISS